MHKSNASQYTIRTVHEYGEIQNCNVHDSTNILPALLINNSITSNYTLRTVQKQGKINSCDVHSSTTTYFNDMRPYQVELVLHSDTKYERIETKNPLSNTEDSLKIYAFKTQRSNVKVST
jgi:hypothetical protein